MTQVSYPEDRTGLSPANKVTAEPHVLTEINAATYRILIPDFAPFYSDNYVMKSKDTLGNLTVLILDRDYVLTLPYLSASQAVGKMLYGGVAMITEIVQGSLELDYQTLGGTSIADVQAVREALYELTTNPRISTWDLVANKPTQFPPGEHDHDLSDIDGSDEIVAAIEDVCQAIKDGPDPTGAVVAHLTDMNNPHETNKAQVLLGNVDNFPTATEDEITNRTPADAFITLKQALEIFQQVPP